MMHVIPDPMEAAILEAIHQCPLKPDGMPKLERSELAPLIKAIKVYLDTLGTEIWSGE